MSHTVSSASQNLMELYHNCLEGKVTLGKLGEVQVSVRNKMTNQCSLVKLDAIVQQISANLSDASLKDAPTLNQLYAEKLVSLIKEKEIEAKQLISQKGFFYKTIIRVVNFGRKIFSFNRDKVLNTIENKYNYSLKLQAAKPALIELLTEGQKKLSKRLSCRHSKICR